MNNMQLILPMLFFVFLCLTLWILLRRYHPAARAGQRDCQMIVDLVQLPQDGEMVLQAFLEGDDNRQVEQALLRSLHPIDWCTLLVLEGTADDVLSSLHSIHLFPQQVFLVKASFCSEAQRDKQLDSIAYLFTAMMENKVTHVHAFQMIDPSLDQSVMKVTIVTA